MSTSKLPEGFTNLTEASEGGPGRRYNLIGVCTFRFPVEKSKGSDYTTKFRLKDSGWIGEDGLAFRFFARTEEDLPKIKENGDVLICRQIKFASFAGRSAPIAYANDHVQWTLLPYRSLLKAVDGGERDFEIFTSQGRGRSSSELPREVLQYAISLTSGVGSSQFQASIPKTEAGDTATQCVDVFRRKFSLVKDLPSPVTTRGLVFADLMGQIRRVWQAADNRAELYVTDYTEHPLLRNYSKEQQARDGDDFAYIPTNNHKWEGPWGRMTIMVTLFDEHSREITNKQLTDNALKVGVYVRVKNAQIKIDRDGSHLEAVVRGGNNSSRVTVHMAHHADIDDDLKALLERKREYESSEKTTAGEDDSDRVCALVPKTEHSIQALSSEKDATKPRKKNFKKKKRQQEKASAAAHAKHQALTVNQHVRCQQIEVPLRTIDDICDDNLLKRKTMQGCDMLLPFQNCKYKSKVQVFDFFPDQLEDFAVPYRVTDAEVLPDYNEASEEPVSHAFVRQTPDLVKWKWQFWLWVEDVRTVPANRSQDRERSYIMLQIADNDGDQLLNAEACDLRKNPQQLAQLREKLFFLWGDLEEKKAELKQSGEELRKNGVKSSARPFECFIREYGVRARDLNGEICEGEWERMFRMFGTRIVSGL